MALNTFTVNYYYHCSTANDPWSRVLRLEHRNPYNKAKEEFILWDRDFGESIDNKELCEKSLKRRYDKVVLAKKRVTMRNTSEINVVIY